jgi:hypothetical protein
MLKRSLDGPVGVLGKRILDNMLVSTPGTVGSNHLKSIFCGQSAERSRKPPGKPALKPGGGQGNSDIDYMYLDVI